MRRLRLCFTSCFCLQAVCERQGEAGEHISMAVMQQRPDAVVSELFSSVCAEIRDEVGGATLVSMFDAD